MQPSLRGDGGNRRPLRAVLGACAPAPAARSARGLQGNTCLVVPWVHPLNEWALRQTRYDSVQTGRNFAGQAGTTRDHSVREAAVKIHRPSRLVVRDELVKVA